MYIHLYSRGKDYFDEKLDVDHACQLIELQQTKSEEPENFIGFTHPHSEDAVIQFIRETKDKWILDIPIIENDDYAGSLITILNHSMTLIVVVEFYHTSEFQRAVIDKKYQKIREIFRDRWSIAFDIVKG